MARTLLWGRRGTLFSPLCYLCVIASQCDVLISTAIWELLSRILEAFTTTHSMTLAPYLNVTDKKSWVGSGLEPRTIIINQAQN